MCIFFKLNILLILTYHNFCSYKSKDMVLYIKMNTLNLIELIERNPITRLNKDYQNTLISKIEKSFTETQQQLFLASFFCYLNHDNKKDFIIDFDDVWKWTGFSRKDPAKRLLDKSFKENIDYKVFHQSVENSNEGGRPVHNIMLTINTFKKFCLKADTKKADEIHDYYIKLEELIQETIAEENTIIKNQLIQIENNMNNIEEEFINTKEQYNRLQENHKRILYKRRVHKLRKGKCFYILENTNVKNEKKIGTSINLNSRKSGYNTYFDPNFLYILFTPHFKLIETLVKVKFKNSIKENSDEWIVDIPENIIINFVENMCKELEIEYETFTKLEDIIVDSKKDFSSDDNEEEINEEEIKEEKDKEEEVKEEEVKEEEINEQEDDVDCVEIIYTKEKTKKCTKCLESKVYDDFNKDKTKKDGYHTTCRKCEKESKKIHKQNKLHKIKEDKLNEKECVKCKTVQPISEFTVHLYMKDGYCPNCKSCSRLETNTKRKINKENNVSYSCEICNKSYSRKDTFNKHKKSCS